MNRTFALRLFVGLLGLAGFALSACAASAGTQLDADAATQPEAPTSAEMTAQAMTAAQELPAEPETKEATDGWKRLDLPSLSPKEPFPYTVLVPPSWQHRRDVVAPGVWVGPPSSQPERDPAMIFVRSSPADLSNPTVVATNIRSSAAAAQDWRAPEVEVVDIAGVPAVLVLMERGEGELGKSTFVLKVPLAEGSVDIMAVALTPQFKYIRDDIQRIFFSLREAEQDETDEQAPTATEGAE